MRNYEEIVKLADTCWRATYDKNSAAGVWAPNKLIGRHPSVGSAMPLATLERMGIDIPVVPRIFSQIKSSVEGENKFFMGCWHSAYVDEPSEGFFIAVRGFLDVEGRADVHACATAHCIGGWAIHLAGPVGYDLARELRDSRLVASLIFFASAPWLPEYPPYYGENYQGLDYINRMAELELHEA